MSHLISYVTTKYLKKSNEMRGMKQNKKRSTGRVSQQVCNMLNVTFLCSEKFASEASYIYKKTQWKGEN